MCGITLLYNPVTPIEEQTLKEITLTLKHRGPDAQDYKLYENGRLGIGHTRLSLVDLSSQANQPLEIDNFSISFNGEIYNYQLLREELRKAGYRFITTSDTEVIIRAIQHWGIDQALTKFNGCFAFILYDKKNRKLYIARDPLGEKQLVYTRLSSGEWVFASEIKALIKHPGVKRSPNINRFMEELLFNMYSAPEQTFFENIYHFHPDSVFDHNIQ